MKPSKTTKVAILPYTNHSSPQQMPEEQKERERLLVNYLKNLNNQDPNTIRKNIDQFLGIDQIPIACFYLLATDSRLPKQTRENIQLDFITRLPIIIEHLFDLSSSNIKSMQIQLAKSSLDRINNAKKTLAENLQKDFMSEQLFFHTVQFANIMLRKQPDYIEKHKDNLIYNLIKANSFTALKNLCTDDYALILKEFIKLLSYEQITTLLTMIVNTNKMSSGVLISLKPLIVTISHIDKERIIGAKIRIDTTKTGPSTIRMMRTTAEDQLICPHQQDSVLTRIVDDKEGVNDEVARELRNCIYSNLLATSFIPRKNIDYPKLRALVANTDIMTKRQIVSVLISIFIEGNQERNITTLVKYCGVDGVKKFAQLYSRNPTLLAIQISDDENNLIVDNEAKLLVEQIFNTMKFDSDEAKDKYTTIICEKPQRIANMLKFHSLQTILLKKSKRNQQVLNKLNTFLKDDTCTPTLISTHPAFFAQLLEHYNEMEIMLSVNALHKFIANNTIIPHCLYQFTKAIADPTIKIELFNRCSPAFVRQHPNLFTNLFTDTDYSNFRRELTSVAKDKIIPFLSLPLAVANMSLENSNLLYAAMEHDENSEAAIEELLQAAILNNQAEALSTVALEKAVQLNSETIYHLLFSDKNLLKRVCSARKAGNHDIAEDISEQGLEILLIIASQNTDPELFTDETFSPVIRRLPQVISSWLSNDNKARHNNVRQLFKISTPRHTELFSSIPAAEFTNLVDLNDNSLLNSLFLCAAIEDELTVYLTNNINALSNYPEVINQILQHDRFRTVLRNMDDNQLLQLLRLNDYNLTANLWTFGDSMRLERIINNAEHCTEIFAINKRFAELLCQSYDDYSQAVINLGPHRELVILRKEQFINIIANKESYRKSLNSDKLALFLAINDNEISSLVAKHYHDFRESLLELATNNTNILLAHEFLLSIMIKQDSRSLPTNLYQELLNNENCNIKFIIKAVLVNNPDLLFSILPSITVKEQLYSSIVKILNRESIKPTAIDINLMCALATSSPKIHNAFMQYCTCNPDFIFSHLIAQSSNEAVTNFCNELLRTCTRLPSDRQLLMADASTEYLISIVTNPYYYSILNEQQNLACSDAQLDALIQAAANVNNDSPILGILYHQALFMRIADKINKLADDNELTLLTRLFKLEARLKPSYAEESIFVNLSEDNLRKLYAHDATIIRTVLEENYFIFSSSVVERMIISNIDNLVAFNETEIDKIENIITILTNPFFRKYFHMHMKPKHLTALINVGNNELTALVKSHLLTPIETLNEALDTAKTLFHSYKHYHNILNSLEKIYTDSSPINKAKYISDFIIYQKLSNDSEIKITLSPQLIHPNLLYLDKVKEHFEKLINQDYDGIVYSYINELANNNLPIFINASVSKLKIQIMLNYLAKDHSNISETNNFSITNDIFNTLLHDIMAATHEVSITEEVTRSLQADPQNEEILATNIQNANHNTLTAIFETILIELERARNEAVFPDLNSALDLREGRSDNTRSKDLLSAENLSELSFAPPPPPPVDNQAGHTPILPPPPPPADYQAKSTTTPPPPQTFFGNPPPLPGATPPPPLASNVTTTTLLATRTNLVTTQDAPPKLESKNPGPETLAGKLAQQLDLRRGAMNLGDDGSTSTDSWSSVLGG